MKRSSQKHNLMGWFYYTSQFLQIKLRRFNQQKWVQKITPVNTFENMIEMDSILDKYE